MSGAKAVNGRVSLFPVLRNFGVFFGVGSLHLALYPGRGLQNIHHLMVMIADKVTGFQAAFVLFDAVIIVSALGPESRLCPVVFCNEFLEKFGCRAARRVTGFGNAYNIGKADFQGFVAIGKCANDANKPAALFRFFILKFVDYGIMLDPIKVAVDVFDLNVQRYTVGNRDDLLALGGQCGRVFHLYYLSLVSPWSVSGFQIAGVNAKNRFACNFIAFLFPALTDLSTGRMFSELASLVRGAAAKSAAGIGVLSVKRRPNRAKSVFARFSYGRACGRTFGSATPFGGNANPARPATRDWRLRRLVYPVQTEVHHV
ncbi:hypothetical protein [Thalassospira marina]|uniref:hypothetical protein n=1 Tax=Thalassospira marina TaxID=2048283 RepID=UPI0013FD8DAD